MTTLKPGEHIPFAYACPYCGRKTKPVKRPPGWCFNCGRVEFVLTDKDLAFLRNRARRVHRERLLARIEVES